jgi:hypothetical protein
MKSPKGRLTQLTAVAYMACPEVITKELCMNHFPVLVHSYHSGLIGGKVFPPSLIRNGQFDGQRCTFYVRAKVKILPLRLHIFLRMDAESTVNLPYSPMYATFVISRRLVLRMHRKLRTSPLSHARWGKLELGCLFHARPR